MSFDFSYRKLNVYNLSKELVQDVYGAVSLFPKTEQYALGDQLRRAVVSVPSNIAEGTTRQSSKEQYHFLEIAFGSLMETICQMEIANSLSYISQEKYNEIECKIIRVYKMLSAMQSTLKNRIESDRPQAVNICKR
jgi:four helix bundle protein